MKSKKTRHLHLEIKVRKQYPNALAVLLCCFPHYKRTTKLLIETEKHYKHLSKLKHGLHASLFTHAQTHPICASPRSFPQLCCFLFESRNLGVDSASYRQAFRINKVDSKSRIHKTFFFQADELNEL